MRKEVAEVPMYKLNNDVEIPALGLGAFRAAPAQKIVAVPSAIQNQLRAALIPKSVRPERIVENIDIFDFVLSSDEVQSISALDTGERGGPGPSLASPGTFPVSNGD